MPARIPALVAQVLYFRCRYLNLDAISDPEISAGAFCVHKRVNFSHYWSFIEIAGRIGYGYRSWGKFLIE